MLLIATLVMVISGTSPGGKLPWLHYYMQVVIKKSRSTTDSQSS